MKKILLSTLLSFSLLGCASYKLGPTDFSQGFDTATTAIAVYGTNAVETNVLFGGIVSEPLGMVAFGLFKEGLVVLGRSLPLEGCKIVSGGLFGLGVSAGLNNIIVMAGAVTPGAAVVAPAAFLIWLVYDYFRLWKHDCKV